LELTIATARRCAALGVEVGAHPGYPDRDGFGRFELNLTAAEIERLVHVQVASLAGVAEIAYLKPHGALYHRCQQDAEAADALARIAASFGIGLVGEPRQGILAAAARAGLPAYREGFADRRYRPEGGLAPRSQPDAVLGPKEAAEQALRLARSGEFDTICLHGDSPGAGKTARAIRAALAKADLKTGPLRLGKGCAQKP
jgi:5-oxoprolinase (ATP-hydrolysing) subunit A